MKAQPQKHFLTHFHMKEFYGGCKPTKDSRDFFAEHVLGGPDRNFPESFRMGTKANNQGASSKTRVACTCFSSYNVATILNEIEHSKEIVQMPDLGWEAQKAFGTYSLRGDSLSTALKSIIKNGLITKDKSYPFNSYAQVKNADLKYWLSQGYPIITYGPVTKTNFSSAKNKGVYDPQDGNPITTYHAFAIVGYFDDTFVCMNSYGPTWGLFKDGTFHIKESELGNIGSKYILYDIAEEKMLFRDVSEKSPHALGITWCLENGIMKGENADNEPDPLKRFFKPDQPVSRGELATILYRLHKVCVL